MKYTDVTFCFLLASGFLLGCAGPSSPFGGLDFWSGDGEKFLFEFTEMSAGDFSLHPKRQVLHKPSNLNITFNIDVQKENSDEAKSEKPQIKVIYNQKEVTNTFFNSAKLQKNTQNTDKQIQYVFNKLILKPDRRHKIDVYWREKKTENYSHFTYLPPDCSLNSSRQVASTAPFYPKQEYLKIIRNIASAQQLNPSLLAGLIAQESGFVSTRISYALTGNYRGAVNGTAQVEWIRAGADYQVHLDLVVGPGFAPLITRRMSSDGAITAAGLAPRRYDEDTRVMLRDRNRITLRFEPGSVVLANGERRDTVPGVQDTASQFVQLTYVFSTRPELLRVGGTVDIPLALKNKVDVWTYDVVGEEVLATAFGPLPTLHLTPQRPPRPGDLSAEIWFAPQLRYLPVRIRIRQDAQTFIDLLISKRPELG